MRRQIDDGTVKSRIASWSTASTVGIVLYFH